MSGEFAFTERLRTVSDRDLPRLAEHFTEPAERFDASTMGDHVLFPLEMTWFYGEPVWERLSAEQRLKLNRLTFCQSYLSTAVAEAATNVLNYEAALQDFIHADPEVALYMAREVVEETSHLHAFLIVIRKVLAHYGLSLEELRATNVSLRMASDYVQVHTLIGALRGDLYYYYFTRFPLNVNQKTVERCTINEPNMHPCVRADPEKPRHRRSAAHADVARDRQGRAHPHPLATGADARLHVVCPLRGGCVYRAPQQGQPAAAPHSSRHVDVVRCAARSGGARLCGVAGPRQPVRTTRRSSAPAASITSDRTCRTSMSSTSPTACVRT